MKKMVKNFLVVAIAAFLLLGSSVAGTIAYFSDEQEVVNTFTIGNVTTEIEESFEQETETVFTKTPYIVNTGKNDCYVRMRVVSSPEEALSLSGFDTSNWTKKADGFYYYNHVLRSGEKTVTPLFDQVEVIDTSIDGFEVAVYQEAVQTILYAQDSTYTENMAKIWECYDNKMVPGSFGSN